MDKDCNCTGRPCYECSIAGSKPEVDDSLATFLGYN